MSDYQSETGNTSADHYSIVKSDDFICKKGEHSINFPRGVVHRVENGWGLTKVAAVLLNGLLW